MGMLLLLGAVALQDGALTREAIEKALEGDLKGVEIVLVHHSGKREEGLTTRIRGDGSVETAWRPWHPMTAAEKESRETLRLPLSREELGKLVRLFLGEKVLWLPKTDSGAAQNEMRYAVSLKIEGAGSFEGEHPDVDWSKRPQSPGVQALIRGIRDAVKAQRARIAKEDAAFLTGEKIAELAKDGEANLVLQLEDIQGLGGGRSIRVSDDGRLVGVAVRPPQAKGEKGMQQRHFKGEMPAEQARALILQCVEQKTFDLVPKREFGVPDEVRPTLTLKATLKGATWSRTIALWGNEARETPAFETVRQALQKLAAAALERY